MKILIAEDDPVSRRLMERTLQRAGYDVVTAVNGALALEELSKEEGPRLALLDWMMPEMDGLEVCRRVRRRVGGPYIYITMLTSKLSENDVIAGLEAGADDYLTKPCNPEELKARLRSGQRVLRLEDTLTAAWEEMRFKATHDALTGLLNRSAILARVGSELKPSERTNTPISLLICDLDHFKQVNDIYGHLAGDEVLRQVAARLRAAVRSCDDVGRYGGEEFLILLNDCPRARLADHAERVREAVSSKPFIVDNVTLSMSLSLGSVAASDWNCGLIPEQLLKEADAALYRAKAAGRNRVCHADPRTTKGDELMTNFDELLFSSSSSQPAT